LERLKVAIGSLALIELSFCVSEIISYLLTNRKIPMVIWLKENKRIIFCGEEKLWEKLHIVLWMKPTLLMYLNVRGKL
jgi:hypothetical protein